MCAMRNDSPLAVIWRRKGIIIAVFLAFAVTTAVVSKTLDKVYATHSTLFISLPSDAQSFDTVQASQALARSYAQIIESPNMANRVAQRVGGDPGKLLSETTFEPIEETQLLKIEAEDKSPERARDIANAWADVAIAYSRTQLQANTRANMSLADPAPLRTQAVRPKPTLYTLIAAILGLALGVALAFLRDRLDRRLRTAHDVEERFDVPVLARIPRRGRSDYSLTAFREAYRILRTNLHFASKGGRVRSIAVTSGQEGEGKTTTVAELAAAFAEVGLRVIVVEADFRRPALQRAMMPDGGEPLVPGFSNYLVEAAELGDVLFPTGRPNIDLLAPGPLPPSPSALLESRRGRAAVEELYSEADIVLIDCPPLTIGADASVIAGWVDGVIVVVDLHSSTYDSVRDGLRQLDAVQATTVGLVLNRDRGAEPSSYDYYAPMTTAADKASKSKAKAGSGS